MICFEGDFKLRKKEKIHSCKSQLRNFWRGTSGRSSSSARSRITAAEEAAKRLKAGFAVPTADENCMGRLLELLPPPDVAGSRFSLSVN